MSAPTAPRLGIDFGTTHTVAALVGADGRSQPILFDASFLLPSAVFADTDGRLLVGKDAERSARLDPTRFEPNPKRRVDDGAVLLGTREIAVADLIAAVLRRVADEAARVAGALPPTTVLTYPANWAASRKALLATAAQRAGMRAVTLVPEPIAAAVYFTAGLGRLVAAGATIVVYDFGGGTFDTSVLRRRPDGGWDVLASDGLPDLGGIDLDGAIVEHLRVTFGARDPQLWRRLVQPDDEVARRRNRMLWDDVRAAKEQLSRSSSASLHVPLFDTDAYLTREEFERLARPYVERTVDVTAAALQRVGVRPDQVAGLFLVGGSSRIPLVSTLLHHRLGVAPTLIEQPELVVALGSVLSVGPATLPAPPTSAPPMAAPPISAPPISAPPVSPAPVAAAPMPGSPIAVGSVSGPPVSGAPAAPVPGNLSPVWPAPVGAPAPPVRKRGPRPGPLLAVAAALVLLLGVGGTVAWNAMSDDSNKGSGDRGRTNAGSNNAANPPGQPASQPSQPSGGDTSPVGEPAAAGEQVTVNKTVWYAGRKLTFNTVAYDTEHSQVVAKVVMENLGAEDVYPRVDITYAFGGQFYDGSPRESSNQVPGQQRSNVEFEFRVPALPDAWKTGILYIGKGEEERAVVPLGDGELVAHEPKLMFENRTVKLRDITVRFVRCELRSDFVEMHKQVDKDNRAVACSIEMQTSAYSHYLGAENFRIKLPDGSVIGPTAKPSEALSGNERKPDYLGFTVKWPKAPGTYTMQVVDLHYGEKPSPASVHQFAITL